MSSISEIVSVDGEVISLTECASRIEFEYKVDNYYDKQSERTIYFADPELAINWGTENPILIEREKNAPLLKDCDINF